MKNMKCAFHSTENIVNFCRNQECLLPMCPTCVKVHSKEHMSENTHGMYENIHEIYSQTQNNLNEVIQSLANCGDDLKEAYQKKQMRKELLAKKMQDMRTKMMDSINKYIDNIEKQILLGIQNIQSTLEQDFANVNERIESFSSEVKKQLEVLTNDKPLKTIIAHFAQDKPQLYGENIEEINDKIRQINRLDISVSKEFKISQLSEILKNIKSCYKSVFVETLNRKPLKEKSLDESNISKISNSSKHTDKANSMT